MDSPFENWLTKGAALAAVAFSIFAVWQWQRVTAPDAAPVTAAAQAWNGPIGPGLASSAAPQLTALGAHLAAPGEPGLATDAAGHLVPSLALRSLIDSYLVRGPAAGRPARAGELRAMFRRTLAAPAAAEAEHIVARYLDYLDAEERMLARERFSAPAAGGLSERDVEHLLAWQGQRAQQRERVLGQVLAQAWFADDDARCGAMLHDWQLQHVAPAPGEELDQAELRERRLHGAVLQERRDADAQRCAAQMTGAAGTGE